MDPHTSSEQPSENIAPAEPVVSASEQRSAPKPYRMYAAVIVSILALCALGFFLYTKTTVDIAAKVNGSKITRAEVEENIAMMTKSAELQGIDVSDPAVVAEIQKQALDNLINNELPLR